MFQFVCQNDKSIITRIETLENMDEKQKAATRQNDKSIITRIETLDLVAWTAYHFLGQNDKSIITRIETSLEHHQGVIPLVSWVKMTNPS